MFSEVNHYRVWYGMQETAVTPPHPATWKTHLIIPVLAAGYGDPNLVVASLQGIAQNLPVVVPLLISIFFLHGISTPQFQLVLRTFFLFLNSAVSLVSSKYCSM